MTSASATCDASNGCTSAIDADERRTHLLRTIEHNVEIANTIIPQIERLLSELSARTKNVILTGLPGFLNTLKDAHKTLLCARHALDSGSDESTLKHSSKLIDTASPEIHHGSVRWHILKQCKSLVAVSRTFQGSDRDERHKQVSRMAAVSGKEKQQLHRQLKEQAKVEVDVVDKGHEWIDIRWITRDKLARQMAECGWAWGDHPREEQEEAVDPDEWHDIALVKQVKRLVVAARMNRHEYRIPRIRVVLPNLTRDAEDIDIDVLLHQLHSLDPAVQLTIHDASDLLLQSSGLDFPVSVDDAIANLVGNDLDGLTPTLNIDHTVLVDLISDLTHYRLTPQPWQEKTTRAQIDSENEHADGLMMRTLTPILAGRSLLCTREAAEHFHDMLTTVGTRSERLRGQLLVPLHEPEASLGDATLRQMFEQLSVRHISKDIQIPIRILPASETWDRPSVDRAVDQGTLPPVARSVAARSDQLKSSKLSIYMYGWNSGCVTVTSNKEIKAHMKTWVEAGRTNDDEVGPFIWSIPVTRNLLAKSADPPPGWDSSKNAGCV